MTAVIGVLPLVGLLGFIIALMAGVVPHADRLASVGSPASHAILESLVGAVAVATLLAEVSEGSFGAATVGAGLGLISAIRVRAPEWASLSAAFSILYGAAGVFAAVIAVIGMFDSGCAGETPVHPVVISLLVAAVAALSLTSSFFSFSALSPGRLSAVGVGWFASAETLAVLSSPVGLQLFPTTAWYFIGLVLFSIVVGLGLGVAPEPVFILVSVAFLLATASTATSSDSTCQVPHAMTAVTVLLSFLAVHLLVGMVLRMVR